MKNIAGAAQQTAEWDWAASHFDMVVGGTHSEYKQRNPSVVTFSYDLIWAPESGRRTEMESWLAANGYPVEAAYLHGAGTSKSAANRINFVIWNSARQAVNPGDAGWRAWVVYRTGSLIAGSSDAVFYDEMGGSLESFIPSSTLEYPNRPDYFSKLTGVMGTLATGMDTGCIMPNVGTTRTPTHTAYVDASGCTMMEYSNDIYNEGAYTMWGWVAQRMAAGTVIMLTPQRQGQLKNTPRYNMNAGNYSTVAERVLLAEYANYLMMVDPTRMDQLYVDFYLTGSLDPNEPHALTWLKAFETDIGPAVGNRSILKHGTDGIGRPYDAFQREFANALVVYRPLQSWAHTDFGDATTEPISLPTGNTWRMLMPDGSLVGPLTSVQLRNGEAAIFMKS
jgi:hypothetical protein